MNNQQLKKNQEQMVNQLGVWFFEKRIGYHKLVYSNKIKKEYQIFYNRYHFHIKSSHKAFSCLKDIPSCQKEIFLKMEELYEEHMKTIGF